MRSGPLRHKITLQRPGGSRDAVGGRITTWTDVADVRASVEPLSGREEFLAAQREASTTHKVTLRHASALAAMDATWRVRFGVRVFTIDEPPRNIQERNREVVLMCTEGLRTE